MNLKKLRKQRGETQQQIADMLGLSRASYTKYENGMHEPSFEVLNSLAKHFGVTVDYILGRSTGSNLPNSSGGVWIPVVGRVAAGIPIEAIEEIEDYEEIPKDMAEQGEHFALRVQGNSMEPRIVNGDVVIVRRQNDCETGDIAVVLVDGNDATIKRIKKGPAGMMLIPSNPAFEPVFYSNEEIKKLPVTIIGKIVELRAKF